MADENNEDDSWLYGSSTNENQSEDPNNDTEETNDESESKADVQSADLNVCLGRRTCDREPFANFSTFRFRMRMNKPTTMVGITAITWTGRLMSRRIMKMLTAKYKMARRMARAKTTMIATTTTTMLSSRSVTSSPARVTTSNSAGHCWRPPRQRAKSQKRPWANSVWKNLKVWAPSAASRPSNLTSKQSKRSHGESPAPTSPITSIMASTKIRGVPIASDRRKCDRTKVA